MDLKKMSKVLSSTKHAMLVKSMIPITLYYAMQTTRLPRSLSGDVDQKSWRFLWVEMQNIMRNCTLVCFRLNIFVTVVIVNYSELGMMRPILRRASLKMSSSFNMAQGWRRAVEDKNLPGSIIGRYHKEKYSLKKSYPLTKHTNWRINYVNGFIMIENSLTIPEMDRHALFRPLSMLRTIEKLDDSKYIRLEEQVPLFLYIIVHHTRNQIGFIRVLFKQLQPIKENSRGKQYKVQTIPSNALVIIFM
ncbi:hypothetical protein Cgig2_015051 [Carnegiea gigantea]|uniref:Uncharacterized protein n=1 Tax=Carnegiea gigantea TaxID=171969 RepID=A0A9Q1K6I2_9CARY|nr:hypothetical protein Cgig2_015051 [Carnegiea gigantea]